ncbi:uncharacterized protein [Coffea arabica]|uniref:Integrase catalytic domain-containing protein n=1 Tax=Coffea arabica TaxID=13443 RepID=A0ABM4WMJ7_COFAR
MSSAIIQGYYLLQSLEVPEQAWQHISMDFIEGLPKSFGSNVVVDRFTKYAHFIPLASHYTAKIVADTFFDQIFKLHGLPLSIISDRDKVFSSAFWQELFRENLLQAQNRIKQLADRNRTERSFEVGDWVYLKLQPYRQTSIALRKKLKLAAKHYRPYQIELKLGPVAYKLKLPEGSTVHPVFHVSLLKESPKGAAVSTGLLELNEHDEIRVVPLAVLDMRVINRNGVAVEHMLIQWENMALEELKEPLSNILLQEIRDAYAKR